jgi:hypothetical protein
MHYYYTRLLFDLYCLWPLNDDSGSRVHSTARS